MRIVLALLLLSTLSCKEDASDPAASALSSCDRAANRLNEICGVLAGEDYRALCEVEEFPFYSDQDMACVARMTECDEAAFERCNIRSVTIACSAADPCFAPLVCDVEENECVRCLAHADCAQGRACLMGLCFDEDSEQYRQLAAIFGQDAGAAAGP